MEPIIYTIYIAATPERIWQAFIRDEDVKAVWWGCTLQTSLTPGEPYAYVGPGADGEQTVHVMGEILEAVSFERLVMTERPGPAYNPEGEERTSRMTFTIAPVTSHISTLTVVNDNWSDGHPGYEETKSTWPLLFGSIKTYIETGTAFSFDD